MMYGHAMESPNAARRRRQAQVGHRLRAARRAQDLLQADVAEVVGMPRASLSTVETGRRSLSFLEAVALCEVLRVSIYDLAAAARLDSTDAPA
jgi:transcriptional regulator with XRE-family HTH domain